MAQTSAWKFLCTLVTAVTERVSRIGDTPFVNMVRRARKNVLLEPGDTK